MNLFELFAVLGLDSSQYEEGLERAESMGSRFGSGIRTATRAVGIAIAGATTATVGFATTSVRAGAEFDSAMSQVASTMGTTVDQIQDLRDFAQEMGSTTAFSATQSAEALNYMALAGYDAETSMSMLPTVLNLASAGSIGLAEASDMVTDASSALGLSIEETTAMVDQMASASSHSNTSVAQLGDALLTLGATGANAVGGTVELSTVLGVLADNGIKGAEAGTHYRNMILSLTNPTTQASEALADLGIAVYDEEGNMRSMIDIIGELQTALDGMPQEGRDEIIGNIFNRADMASVNALLNTGAERYEELAMAIDDSAGASERMAETQLDNLAGDITIFKSALEGAQIAISDSLTPTIRDFVQVGTEGLSAVTEGFNERGLEGAMSALGEWLSQALTMIVDMTPDIVSAGLQLLSALGTALVENAPAIVDSALEVAQILIDSFTASVNGDGTTRLMDTAFMIISKLGDFLIQNAPTLISTAVQLITQLVSYFLEPDNMMMLLQLGLDIIIAIADGLVQAIPDLLAIIPELFASLMQVSMDSTPMILEFVQNFLGDLALMVLGLLGGLLGMSYDEVMSSLTATAQFLSQSLENIKTAISSAFTTITDWVSDGIEGWVNFFSDGFDSIYSTVSGILDSVLSVFTSIFDDVRGVVSSAVDFLMGAFDFEWSLPDIQLPHFSITGGVAPYGLGGQGTFPSISVDWYAKAMNQPMILNDPTIFGMGNGNMLGAGEAGAELIVGWNELKKELGGSQGVYEIHVHNYIGGDEIDELVINSNQINDKISGGRG